MLSFCSCDQRIRRFLDAIRYKKSTFYLLTYLLQVGLRAVRVSYSIGHLGCEVAVVAAEKTQC